MVYETILYEDLEPGIGVLSLNRPRLYNSVNKKMVSELESFFLEIGEREDVNVLLLKGNGEKGFCAGLDLKETSKLVEVWDARSFYMFQKRLARLVLKLRAIPQPVICLIHGAAVGLGFSLALASDIRIGSKDARFCAVFINIGLGGADMACSYLLPRVIGAGRASELMLTGDFLSAEEAFNLGMLSRLVDREELWETGVQMARSLNSKNPLGLVLTKEAINMNLDAPSLEHAL
ncbi:MAG: enoyl-CoA hydratase/isomerase family protein, partial [Desulfatiglandales bacterium]